MAFSSDDIQASIEKLVLSSIRRPFDTLGTRRVDISFNDVQEAAAGVFLLVTSAPFYVAFLGAQHLLELIKIESVIVGNLLAAINATGRKVFPIKDLTPLSNASAALFELEAAVGRRSQSFKSIETVPAYQRFKDNLDQFLSTAGANVKANGDIVQTPQEARAAIPRLVDSLKSSHLELARRATVLAAAIDDYAKVNLPALAAAGVISRARQLVQTHVQTLDGMGEKERLSVLRPIVLDLLSSKAVVKKYGSFVGPASLLDVTGTGTPYSDALHLANGGSIVGDLEAPFAIVSGKNTLDLRLDSVVTAKVSGNVDSITPVNGYKAQFNRAAGSFITDGVSVGDVIYVNSGADVSTRWMVLTVAANALQAMGQVIPLVAGLSSVEIWPAVTESIALALSYVASVEGSAREPFTAVFGQNDQIELNVDGTPTTIILPAGLHSAKTACIAINIQLATDGLDTIALAEPYLSPIRFDGIVDIVADGFFTTTFTLQSGRLDGLGVVVGDLVQILSGPNAGTVAAITAVSSSPVISVEIGDGSLVSNVGDRIQIGAVGRKVRVRLSSPAAALAGLQTISCVSGPSGEGAALLLGFPIGAVFVSRPTRASELLVDFNGKTGRGRAERVLTEVTDAILGRSKPGSISSVVLYRFRGQGDIVATPGAIAVTSVGLLEAGVQVGDLVALREGADPDSIWTITAVTDTSLTATGVITTTSATDLLFEVGPNLAAPVGRLLQVITGPNAGEFVVTGAGAVPFDLVIDGFLPFAKDVFAQPVFFSAALYSETIAVFSKNATTASRVTLNGFGGYAITTTLPISGGGTTSWFKLPLIPGDLRPGDFLDVYATDYNTPSESFIISSVDKSLMVIELDHPLDSTVTWAFGASPPPFARLRSGRVFDYSVLQRQLAAWSSLLVNQPAFFVDLNRFLNPLLVNENPTDVQINDAKNRLMELVAVLDVVGAVLADTSVEATLEAALDGYVVEPVAEVDTLFRTFKEKGSDRATDLLTEGQFTTFFGLSIDGASYAGDMQEKMRVVAREDLPVRKVDRDDASSSRQVVEVEDTDFEYSKDDIDDVLIDPPVN